MRQLGNFEYELYNELSISKVLSVPDYIIIIVRILFLEDRDKYLSLKSHDISNSHTLAKKCVYFTDVCVRQGEGDREQGSKEGSVGRKGERQHTNGTDIS